MSIQPFTILLDLPKIARLMEVSITMFNILQILRFYLARQTPCTSSPQYTLRMYTSLYGKSQLFNKPTLNIQTHNRCACG